MKKTLLATAVASIATFGMANAATVYEKDGFKLDLKGSVKGALKTTFGHHLDYNIKAMKAATGDFKDKQKMNDYLYADKDNYKVTQFGAKISGDFSLAPSYAINEGLKVFAGAKVSFTSEPKTYYGSDQIKLTSQNGADPASIKPVTDDKGKVKKATTASYLSFGGGQVGLGGTTILGKLTLGNQNDAMARYVGLYSSNKHSKKLASISYELGPVMGLNLYMGASLPLKLVDNRPDTLNPRSTSGYTTGLKYSLELDKDMFINAGFAYSSFTGNTKRRNPLNSKAYMNWAHELGLKAEFKTELMSVSLAYAYNFVPTFYNEDKSLGIKLPSNQAVKFDFEMGLLEGLTLATGIKYEFKDAAMFKHPDMGGIIVAKGSHAGLGLTDKSKNRIQNESILEFELGLSYEIAKGFTTGLKFSTETSFYSLPINAAGESNKDDAVNTVTAPTLTIDMGYKF